MDKRPLVLLFGGTGLFGASLAFRLLGEGYRVVVAAKSTRFAPGSPIRSVRCDVSSEHEADRLLGEHKPAWVINCIAITNVEACESGGIAERVNTQWPEELAVAAETSGVRCVQISTDSVFNCLDGHSKPMEDDQRNPLNAYGSQKARAEDAVLAASRGKALVVRTNFFGWSPIPERGLAAWALHELRRGHQISGFSDVFFNPLYIGDATAILVKLLDKKTEGLIHLLGAQCWSKLSFLRYMAGVFSLDQQLIKKSRLIDAGFKAARPANTCLATSRLEEILGHGLPSAQEGLDRMFCEEYAICDKLATLEKHS